MAKNHPWKTLSYQQVIDTPYLKVRCEQIAIPNGPIIPDYYIIENRGWVGVVPFTEDGCFLLNNQYKHGIGREVEVIENLLVTPKELLELIHDGSFAVQGQIAAAYMALERLGYFTMKL